ALSIAAALYCPGQHLGQTGQLLLRLKVCPRLQTFCAILFSYLGIAIAVAGRVHPYLILLLFLLSPRSDDGSCREEGKKHITSPNPEQSHFSSPKLIGELNGHHKTKPAPESGGKPAR